MIEYRVATLADAVSIAARLRVADRLEVEASSGLDAYTAVLRSFGDSARTWVAVIDGTPECIFGISEVSPEVGVPWMLGTDEVSKQQRALVRDAKRTVDDMQAAYSTLMNFVHIDNRHSIIWLKRLGFKFLPPIPYGHHQQLFIPFVRHRQCVNPSLSD